MRSLDWSNIIVALIISTPALGTLISSIFNGWKADRIAKQQKIIHDLVNGQSEKLNAMYQEKGEREGADAERANPTSKK